MNIWEGETANTVCVIWPFIYWTIFPNSLLSKSHYPPTEPGDLQIYPDLCLGPPSALRETKAVLAANAAFFGLGHSNIYSARKNVKVASDANSALSQKVYFLLAFFWPCSLFMNKVKVAARRTSLRRPRCYSFVHTHGTKLRETDKDS